MIKGCHFAIIHCIKFAALLKEILKEVQNSNKKVADLEKKLQDLQEAECSGSTKKKKLSPSPEVRVSLPLMFG